MIVSDTICAISSAVGPAARMIVRASGPGAFALAEALTGSSPQPRSALRTHLRFDGLVIPAWLYSFAVPRSYTGEDLVEFHIPGNPLLAKMLLEQLVKRGARHAEAGEFTARAYFNGRLELTEAEGVAATIGARSEQQLTAARQLLSGELARRLRPMMEGVADTLALVEVGIDFSDEDVTFLSSEQVKARADQIDVELDRLLRESARFERLAHEPVFVLVGRPNAGKSTLLNALAGSARAVVSPEAGTTRDALTAEVLLDRGLVRVTDLAGIEDAAPALRDFSPQAEIARQMRRRAESSLASADFVILLQDATDAAPPPRFERRPDLVIRTKADLLTSIPDDPPHISAHTGLNMAMLRQRLSDLAFGSMGSAPTLALNTRHLADIASARQALARARDAASSDAPSEVIALELRETLDALGRVLGQITPDDVLGRVFAAFCIGK